MDNAEFSAFPITEIDTSVIQRSGGGDAVLEARSVWERTGNAGNRPGFIFHDIPIHQQEYATIIDMALRFTDLETNISVLASGEQGATSKTAGGMALLMNSVNVVFRRVVKNFDDGVTTTAISRAYYFAMQFSKREEIKGDYAVEARGSSVLLVREVQAQNLLLLAMQASVHPVLGGHLKIRALLKKLLQSMMIASDDVLKTQAELEADAAQAAQEAQEAPPDPEMVKLQLQREIAQMDGENQFALAQMRHESEAMKLAGQQQISLEQVMARLQAMREQSASKERIFASEAALEARKPPGSREDTGYAKTKRLGAIGRISIDD